MQVTLICSSDDVVSGNGFKIIINNEKIISNLKCVGKEVKW